MNKRIPTLLLVLLGTFVLVCTASATNGNGANNGAINWDKLTIQSIASSDTSTYRKLTTVFPGTSGNPDTIYIPFTGEDGGKGNLCVPTNGKSPVTWKYNYTTIKEPATDKVYLPENIAGQFLWNSEEKATYASFYAIEALHRIMQEPFAHVENVRLYATTNAGYKYLGIINRHEWRENNQSGKLHIDLMTPLSIMQKIPEVASGIWDMTSYTDGSSFGLGCLSEILEYTYADNGRFVILDEHDNWMPVELTVKNKTALERLHQSGISRTDSTTITGFTRPNDDTVYITAFNLHSVAYKVNPWDKPVTLAEGLKAADLPKNALTR